MNLDRLKALIRLANNNPNEHEANLAARKACKVLAENHFALLHEPKTAKGKMDEARTWNDVKRSTEPGFRSKPPNEYTSRDFDFEAIFNEMRRRAEQRAKEEEARGFRNPYNPFAGGTRGGKSWMGFDWNTAPHKDAPTEDSWDRETPKYNPYTTNYNADGTKKKKPEELRKCVRCGLEIMTSRLKEDPWVCNPCHWKDYP